MSAAASNPEDLLARCADRGYTPAVRDVSALLALWDATREEAAPGDRRAAGKQITKALTRGDLGVAQALVSGFGEVAGPQRAMRLAVLTKLVQRFDVEGFGALCRTALADSEPLVVRQACRAMGKWSGAEAIQSEDALIGVCERAALPEQRAAVEALGRVGGAAALACLSEWTQPTDADLVRRIAEASTLIRRRAGRGRAGKVRGDARLPSAVRVRLRCRQGVAPWLVEQLELVRSGGGPEAIAERALVTRREAVELPWSGTLAPLYSARCAIDVGLVFPLPRAADLTERIVAGLSREDLTRALAAWTEGPIRFRLSLTTKGTRRAVLWEVARRLEAAGSPLTNDSRDVAWTIEVDPEASTVACRPKHADQRFAYRTADVPAASHPTIAALLAWVARPRAGEVVWDPFCGSGSELVECAGLARDLHVVGTDSDKAAVEAAVANFAAARLPTASLELSQGDARHVDPSVDGRPVTLIISNPPMGRRVAGDGSMPQLLADTVARAATLLAPGGRMVWLSPTPEATASAARASRLSVTDRGVVDMGGFGATLQVLRKSD